VHHICCFIHTPAGASKALYGFDPCGIVGAPLAAVVDVFGLWRQQFTEDQSLLCLLASQAAAEHSLNTDIDDAGRLETVAAGSSWRVGVHLPATTDQLIAEHAAQLAKDSSQREKVSGCFDAVVAATLT
jgi:hypothetical protein